MKNRFCRHLGEIPNPNNRDKVETKAEPRPYSCDLTIHQAPADAISLLSDPLSISVLLFVLSPGADLHDLLHHTQVTRYIGLQVNAVLGAVWRHPSNPSLSLSPPRQLYLSGESFQLTCSAPRGDEAVTRFQFYKYGGSNISPDVLSRSRNSRAKDLKLEPEHSGSYTCLYWIRPSGREIQSVESAPVSINVTDPPPQPALSVDPPSGAVSEGLHLLMTCTAPRDAGQRRFHFYKD
ncbi:carboxypeptidase [Platysternon megacephalum]|uniref:Carboxypeptidase n=1 Tax=Platysternon megacephalum TaxID=55544 RepID=A0A4D9DLI8_9SAUR|nr:carboxypeptidase [Platysternon megacephalum]